MRESASLIAVLVCACVQHASLAAAQTGGEPTTGRIEVAAGLGRTGATSFGALDATLTAADGSRYRLFSTSSELASASGVELRVGARVARSVDAEVVVAYAIPRLITSITADAENGAATASEPIGQLTIAGAAVVYFPRWLGPRLVPFATAGGGCSSFMTGRR